MGILETFVLILIGCMLLGGEVKPWSCQRNGTFSSPCSSVGIIPARYVDKPEAVLYMGAWLEEVAWSSEGVWLADLSSRRSVNAPLSRRVSANGPIVEFKNSLGESSEFIYDENRQIIGIQEGSSVGSVTTHRPTSSFEPSSSIRSRFGPNSRGAIDCCPTDVIYYMNQTMTDVYGVTRNIAQINDIGSYQFIHHGRCGSPAGQSQCHGSCVMVGISLSLVITPSGAGQSVTTKFFSVPGYCVLRVPM